MMYALRDFTGFDGVKIKKGTKMGELVKTGSVRRFGVDRVQTWNTVSEGKVTAVILAPWNTYVGTKGQLNV